MASSDADFTFDIAIEVATEAFGTRDFQLAPITGAGTVNHVYRAAAGVRAIIIRVATAEDEQRGLAFFEKEAWCIRRAAECGVAGPRVLALSRCRARPYMVEDFVHGIDHRCMPAVQLWRILGGYARRFHAVHIDGFGETLADFGGGAETRWHAFVDYNVSCVAAGDRLVELGVYESIHAGAITTAFEHLRAQTFRFGLVHGDLSIRNIIVDDHQTVTLLDWGCAEAHIVPHYELVSLLRNNELDETELRAFVQGYGIEEDRALMADVQRLHLLKAFDLVRWAIERNPTRIPELAAAARAVVRSYCSLSGL